jgi:vitamin B12 transporter
MPHAALCTALLAGADARADQLDPVTVTATRSPSRVSDTIAEVTVIDRVDLQRATGLTPAQVLSRQPGVQWSANGGRGKASSVFIRGLEARNTLLLVDGVRLGSATVGAPSIESLPLALVDRIEVVRGPLSSLYGSDAVGGVIQVFSRRGLEGLKPDLSAAVGSNGFAQVTGGLAFGQGPFDGAVQFGHQRDDGFSATNPRARFGVHDPDRDGFRQNAGSLRLGWQLNPDWRVDALALGSDGETQYDDGPGVDSRARIASGVAAVALDGRVMPGWRTTLRLGRSTDTYDTLASASPFTPLGATRTEQRQLSWDNLVDTPAGTLLLLAERIEQRVERPVEAYTTSDRTIDAVAAGLTGEAGPHTWQGALRVDRNSQFGTQPTGSVGYAYALTPAWRLGAQYGTSFVAPSFNQLYFPGFGNPTLQPEEGRHAELSVRWASGVHVLRAAWVDHRIRGYIPSGPLPVNVPRTQIDGLALSWQARMGAVVAAASAEFLDPRNATEGSPNDGKLLPRRARNALRAQIDAPLGPVVVGATLIAFSERYEDPANTLRMPGFATVDLRADWALDAAWTVGLRLNNLADKAYETAYGYNQPGREAIVVLRWTPR